MDEDELANALKPLYADMDEWERISTAMVERWSGALDLMGQGPCDGSCSDRDCWTKRDHS